MLRPFLVGSIVMLLSGCTTPPPPEASGEEIYIELCSACHGIDLEGGVGPPLGPDSNSHEQDDEFLRLTVERGRGRMPSFGSTLSDVQLDRLISYLRERQGQ